MSLTIAQQEDLRKACLEFLGVRFPNAYTAAAVGRMLGRRQRVDYPVTEHDVAVAMAWITDAGLAVEVQDELSVIPAWQATSKGAAAYQRKHLETHPEESDR